MSKQILKGNIVSAPKLGELELIENGYIVLDGNKIEGVFAELPEEYNGLPLIDYGDKLILQAMCDMHLHAPQYPMRGVGTDLTLLEWLNTYTFPAETLFADENFARECARRLARDLKGGGTTRVAMFSSMHTPATLALMDELEKAGICGYVGKVNMDRNGGENLQETTEESIRETEKWLDACNFEHIKPMLTPRFTPSCTDELMAWLGEKAKETGLPVQSHLSENTGEVAWVQELCPDCEQYWESYDKFGLFNDGTIMAHCVWSDERERKAMRDHNVWVAHCPNSNNSLISGIAPVRVLLEEGNKVVLGSDIAGGSSCCGFDMVEDAVRASKDRKIMDNFETEFLSVPEAWYLATSAGQEYFGEKPGFAPGNSFHAIVLDDSKLLQPWPMNLRERFERAIYTRQSDAVDAIWSDGRQIFHRD